MTQPTQLRAAAERPSPSPDRRSAIVRLLETMDDNLPTPRSQWTGFGAIPGEKATKKQACRSCDQTGLINTRTGQEACERCDGNGWYLVDGYTGRRENEPSPTMAKQQLGSMTGPEREEWRRRTDATISRIRAQLTPPATTLDEIEEANRNPETWERRRKKMFERYDYHALNQALDRLRTGTHAEQLAAAAAVSVYARGHIELSATLEHNAAAGLTLIDSLMPDPIRAPGHQLIEHPAANRIRRRAA